MSEPQDNRAPRRRWFQFRISTWFVLVAITAWAMVEWPWVRFPEPPPLSKIYFGSKEILIIPWKPSYRERTINPALVYPAIALAAFVGWKWVWLFVERRRNPPATH